MPFTTKRQSGTFPLYQSTDFSFFFSALVSLIRSVRNCASRFCSTTKTCSVLIASILLVTYLSGQLGRIITLPVLKLADTARKIGEQHDYSVRAPVERQNDEIGRLAESFNEMLDRIQRVRIRH